MLGRDIHTTVVLMHPSTGTNTDAVLLDPTKSGPAAVISSFKATTGTDVTTGIEEAIRTLLKQANASPSSVASLMIGTTVSELSLSNFKELF